MIETARLILRVPVPADRTALHAMWADAEVMRDLGPVKDAAASDATLVRHDTYRHEGLGFWSVERAGEVIGFCGLKRGDPGMPIAGELEIGWVLARAAWGQGYAHEAAAATLAWAWPRYDARRIVAITASGNVASRALMAKLGMAHVRGADFPHPSFAPDDPRRATVVHAIDRPE